MWFYRFVNLASYHLFVLDIKTIVRTGRNIQCYLNLVPLFQFHTQSELKTENK